MDALTPDEGSKKPNKFDITIFAKGQHFNMYCICIFIFFLI